MPCLLQRAGDVTPTSVASDRTDGEKTGEEARTESFNWPLAPSPEVEAERRIRKYLNENGYKWYTPFAFAISVIMYLVDIGSDIYLAVSYYKQVRSRP